MTETENTEMCPNEDVGNSLAVSVPDKFRSVQVVWEADFGDQFLVQRKGYARRRLVFLDHRKHPAGRLSVGIGIWVSLFIKTLHCCKLSPGVGHFRVLN